MKIFLMYLTIACFIFTACNNNGTDKQKGSDNNTATTTAASPTTNGGASSVKGIIEDYLHIKNALTQDDGNEAANGGRSLAATFTKFDQSTLTGEQKKIYSDIEIDAKEHAEHIGMNADKIAHQREHFESLSKDIYDLVKAFPKEQTLYNDYCPMYNNRKGAFWVSETKDIKNPYLGKKMPACGEMKEEIK